MLAPEALQRQKAVTRPDRPVARVLGERSEKWKRVSLPSQEIQGLAQSSPWLRIPETLTARLLFARTRENEREGGGFPVR